MGFGGGQQAVAAVRTERGAHAAHERSVLLAVDAERVEVLLAVALRHLRQPLHQARQLQVGAERLRPRECLAARAGHRAVRRRLPSHAAQAGAAEAVAALGRHGRVEQLQAERAGQLLVQEARRSRHDGPGESRAQSGRLSGAANQARPQTQTGRIPSL